jgi:hypothetical protein
VYVELIHEIRHDIQATTVRTQQRGLVVVCVVGGTESSAAVSHDDRDADLPRRVDIAVEEEWGKRTPHTQIVAIGAAGGIDAALLEETVASCASVATAKS